MKKENRTIDYSMANYLRSIVDQSGISQEKWAELLGVTPRMIAYYCSGERTPKSSKLIRIQEISKSL